METNLTQVKVQNKVTTQSKIKTRIQIFLAQILFPTAHRDWYKIKGYGKNGKNPFEDFLEQQRTNPKAKYYKEFKGLKIKREIIVSKNSRGNNCKLDSVQFSPEYPQIESGIGIHIINFFGRKEHYECNFRDLALQAHATGATIHTFNPPGMNSSTGKVLVFKDLTNAGIAQINKLLKEGVHPDKIILQGNCMGSAVIEEVNEHFNKKLNFQFRRINSNSFKSMNALLTYLYPPLLHIKDKIIKLLIYAGWQSTPGKLFHNTDPYKVHMFRKDDKTIKLQASMQTKIKKAQLLDRKKQELTERPNENEIENKDPLQKYEEHRIWLDSNAEMKLDLEFFHKDRKTNPHLLDLYKLKTAKGNLSAYDFINRYIEASNDYVKAKPQKIPRVLLNLGAPYLLEKEDYKMLPLSNLEMKELEDYFEQFKSITDNLVDYSDDFEEENENPCMARFETTLAR